MNITWFAIVLIIVLFIGNIFLPSSHPNEIQCPGPWERMLVENISPLTDVENPIDPKEDLSRKIIGYKIKMDERGEFYCKGNTIKELFVRYDVKGAQLLTYFLVHPKKHYQLSFKSIYTPDGKNWYLRGQVQIYSWEN